MKTFLLKHQYYIQLLFFLKHWIIYNWGFNIGEIINSSLLNSPLLSWDGILNKEYFITMLLYILGEVMLIGTKSNRNHCFILFFFTLKFLHQNKLKCFHIIKSNILFDKCRIWNYFINI